MSNAAIVLEYCKIPRFPNVFGVGLAVERVTFFDQQVRALNLIWALWSHRLLGQETRVCIIGAGLAGMTASAAASVFSHSVTLLERRSEEMHLQLENLQRYVHPNIANWPNDGATDESTMLPILNWKAGDVGNIAHALVVEWRALVKLGDKRQRVKFVRRAEVQGIHYLADYRSRSKPVVQYVVSNDFGAVEFRRQQYDLIIFCAGFGLEKKPAGLALRSYWDNDNFSRPILEQPIPRKILVTGIGDGGLIDAVRLSLLSTTHASFVHDLAAIQLRAQMSDQPERYTEKYRVRLQLERRLRAIEEGAEYLLTGSTEQLRRKLVKQQRLKCDSKNELVDINLLSRELVGEYFYHEYDNLVSDQEFVKLVEHWRRLIKASSRTDVVVVLNGTTSTPFSGRSFSINRFGLFLLLRFGKLSYQPGEVVIKATDGQYKVSFLESGKKVLKEDVFDDVVVRHGTDSPYISVLGIDPHKVIKDRRTGQAFTRYTTEFCHRICRGLNVTYHGPSVCEKDVRKYRPILTVMAQKISAAIGSTDFRLTYWLDDPKHMDKLLMATPYLPESGFREEPVRWLAKNKGLVGSVMQQRAPGIALHPQNESEVEYIIRLMRDFNFSALEAEQIRSNRRAFFAYPVPWAPNVEASGAIYCDFTDESPIRNHIKSLVGICKSAEHDLIALQSK